ncbi:unnamed protein product [Discula destructiva]
MDSLPADFFVTSMRFTKRVSREVYPAVDPSNPELSMTGKVVIITGASQGIGARGQVPAFAKAGAKAVVLVARNVDRLNALAAELNKLYPNVETLVLPADISDAVKVKSLFEKVSATYGHADILVNNAAILKANGIIGSVDPEVWWEDLHINARGTFLMTTGFLKALPAENHGTIINLTSGMAYGIYPGSSAYSLGKLINLQMAAYVAAESKNVTSISLHPGIVKTDMTQESFQKFALDTPELVGGVAVWLSTEKAKFMNGRYMNVNWNVDDLYDRREAILQGKLLQIDLQGTFGAEQFQH